MTRNRWRDVGLPARMVRTAMSGYISTSRWLSKLDCHIIAANHLIANPQPSHMQNNLKAQLMGSTKHILTKTTLLFIKTKQGDIGGVCLLLKGAKAKVGKKSGDISG